MNNKAGPVSIASWMAHRLKRKVRSTLAAESMGASECLEAADILRSHLAEVRMLGDFDRRHWRDNVKAVPVALITDSRSMYDFLHKRGSTPSEKRLRLDLEVIRGQMLEDQLEIKWVATQQQMADALTKGSPAVFVYLKLVMETAEFRISHDERLDERMREFKIH